MLITGIVVDKNTEEGLVGANVFLSDGNGNPSGVPIGSSTDINGVYVIDDLESNLSYVTASYIGYKTTTLPRSSSVNFKLEESNTQLDEFVVEANNNKRKKIITVLTSLGLIAVGIYLIKKFKN